MSDPVTELQNWAQPHLFWGGVAVFVVGLLLLAGILSGEWAGVLAAVIGAGIVVDVIAHGIQH